MCLLRQPPRCPLHQEQLLFRSRSSERPAMVKVYVCTWCYKCYKFTLKLNVSTWFWYKSTLKVNVYVHTWLSRFSVFSNLTQRGSHLTSIASKRELHSKPFIKGEFHAFSFKQGQKLVLSDALAVQFQGYQGPKVPSLKVVLGSQKSLGVSIFFG